MEPPDQSDLNLSIAQWRQTLENSATLSVADLDELELHLRDCIAGLMGHGLEAREGFLVAAHRLGEACALEAEFGKVNVRQVWCQRAIWMLLGLLASHVVFSLASLFGNAVMNVGLWHGMNVGFTCGLSFLAKGICAGGLSLGALLIGRRFMQGLSRAVQASLNHPLWTGLALVVFLEGVQLMPSYAMRLLEPLWQAIANPGRSMAPETQDALSAWLLRLTILSQLFWIASVPLFAGFVRRKTLQGAPDAKSRCFVGPHPDEQDAYRELQTRGLSEVEAKLVIENRRTAVRSQTAKPALRGTVWLERGLWMLTGTVLGEIVLPFMVTPFLVLWGLSSGASPLVQNLIGGCSVFLCLAAMVVLLITISKGLLKYHQQVRWIGKACGEHSWMAAVVAVVGCVAISAALYYGLALLPRQPGIGLVGSRWLDYCGLGTRLAAPVALLIWFARTQNLRTGTTSGLRI